MKDFDNPFAREAERNRKAAQGWRVAQIIGGIILVIMVYSLFGTCG